LWKQWQVERRLKDRDGSFRTTNKQRVVAAYGAMSPREFECVNGSQEWANRHTIPRALRAHRLAPRWFAVDLGCGSGGSSAILARQAPPGSVLVGYDACASLLECAKRRDYRDASGAPMAVRFVCQSITEPLCDPDGAPLPRGSVDLAHSSGVVGHHLTESDVHALADELDRVVHEQGLVLLDAGPRMPAGRLARILAEHGFDVVSRYRVVPFSSRVTLAFQRTGARAARVPTARDRAR
jgi:SAM-dependent methyltransferase